MIPKVRDTTNKTTQRNIYINFHDPQYSTVHFFLSCACFCLVQLVLVLVLVSDSSREASFFLSFGSTAGPLLALLECCRLLLCALKLSAEVNVTSCSLRSLISESCRSQTRTDTPASEHDTDLVRQIFETCNTSISNVFNSPMPVPITSPIGLNLLIC